MVSRTPVSVARSLRQVGEHLATWRRLRDLTAAEVADRYRLRDPRAARRVMREAGALIVGGRLLVRPDALDAWEAARTLPVPEPAAAPPARQRRRAPGRTVELDALPAGWWRK